MGLTSNLISSLLLISYSTAKNLKFPKLINDNVIRNLDLSNSYLKETISVVITSEETKPINDYYFSTSLSTNGSIAKLEVIDKKDKKVLETELSKVQGDKQYYQVKLNSPVTSEEKQAIAIKIYYFDSVKPYPQTIQHTESQKFLFEGNAYFDSPFTSKKQKTSLKLPSVTVHSHTKNPEPALLNKNILTYGPYSDIEANKESTVKVHYDSSKPYIYATEAHRDVELNHWTKDIWVEENYSITNKGPKLTGEFSRVTHAYSKMQALNTATYLESLEMDLPFDANEAYFRDQIGNVSTSNFRLSKSKSKPANFIITPRYPIYGGWKYTWYQGYHLNLFNHVSKASSPDTYTLTFPLLQNFVNTELPIEKFSWKLILPERAELISYDISLPGAKIETIRHYGLLDSVGRTSLLITVDNIGDFSQSQLTFTYQYTFFAMIQKPLVALSFVFGLIALVVIAYNGLSSLKLDSKKKAKKTN